MKAIGIKNWATLLMILTVWISIAEPQHNQQRQSTVDVVQVGMRNVMYHYNDHIAAHLLRVQGKLVPREPGSLPVFDDKESFTLDLCYAEIAISTDALSGVLNDHVFSGADAPLKDLSLSSDKGTLKIRGKLHSKGDIPFEGEGAISATPDGQIRIQLRKIKAAKLPVKGIMDLLGVKIADLIDTKKVRGIRAQDNDLILDPQEALPPPRIQGRVTSVRIVGDEIVQVFGTAPASGTGSELKGNYMAYHGAQLRFGKLTMSDTDMILLDMDPKDPFDFYLDHYKDQLVAGYTKPTPAFGLRVFMRDFNKLNPPRQRNSERPSERN